MQPTVRTLDELMALTNPTYDPQRQQINQNMTTVQTQGQDAERGLYTTQQKAFKDISQLASNKGMFFSGFTPDQQAQYNATEFMPALANLKGKVQDNIAKLQSALLGLNSDQRREAMGMQEGDYKRLYDWQAEQDRRKWEEQQQTVAYQREMEKLRQQQAFEAREGAANRAASAKGSAGASRQEEFAAALAASAGKDGKVSPGTYNALKKQWVSAGYGSFKDFHDKYWKFANQNHWWDYYYN